MIYKPEHHTLKKIVGLVDSEVLSSKATGMPLIPADCAPDKRFDRRPKTAQKLVPDSRVTCVPGAQRYQGRGLMIFHIATNYFALSGVSAMWDLKPGPTPCAGRLRDPY